MEIKVLGGGCSNCDILKGALEDVLETMDKSDIKIEKVTDFVEIAKLGVMKTPALVIDGKVIFSGRMADKGELAEILENQFSSK